MGLSQQEIEKKVFELATTLCTEKGLELFAVNYNGIGPRGLLQVFIDAQDGVTVDDCAAVSKELATLLDVQDLIGKRYALEVSSPGLNRLIRHLDDAKKAVGKMIKIETAPIEERKRFSGILTDVRDDSLVLEVDNKTFIIPWDKVRKANLSYEF